MYGTLNEKHNCLSVTILFTLAVGDSVKEDEEVCHIETDKTSIPVKAPCNGVITELCVPDGSTVQSGVKLFIMTPGRSTMVVTLQFFM